MIRINLVSHRTEFRQQQIIEYIIVFVSVILTSIGIVVAANIWVTQDLTALQLESSNLQLKNKELSKKIGELRNLDSLRTEVEGKLQIVDELQAGRFRSLVTLGGIAKVMPQNIWLTDIEDNKGSLDLDGFGESSQAIANFMRALDASELFSNIELLVDKADTLESANVRAFSLTLHRLTLAELDANAKAESKGGIQ